MPKILYLVTEDWSFCQHFLPAARAARSAGLDVVVAGRMRAHRKQIEAEGFRAVPLENERRSLGPAEILASVWRMVRIIRSENPEIVHCLALRMVVLGGIAAKLAGARSLVLAPTGLGHLWIVNGPVERLLRPLVRFLVGTVLNGRRTFYLFENLDDPKEFGLDPADVTRIGGAGVDPAQFPLSPEPAAPPVKVAVVARMLKPKGIAESVAAVRRAREAGAPVELHLFGAPDPSNRTSCSEDELRGWSDNRTIFWHGSAADIPAVWRDHHVAMLLSYREGLPRALTEASASGRPIVASDVTGCREVVRDGTEGFLVPLGDTGRTAQALIRLANEPDLRAKLGQAAHERFMQRFSEDKVMETARGLYRRCLDVR
ncbi:MAG: glycosyltransferase family 4 protein [Pseudorhodoplanes sp.]